nr:hypothetical protein CFP56_01376 [Quercus suber]
MGEICNGMYRCGCLGMSCKMTSENYIQSDGKFPLTERGPCSEQCGWTVYCRYCGVGPKLARPGKATPERFVLHTVEYKGIPLESSRATITARVSMVPCRSTAMASSSASPLSTSIVSRMPTYLGLSFMENRPEILVRATHDGVVLEVFGRAIDPFGASAAAPKLCPAHQAHARCTQVDLDIGRASYDEARCGPTATYGSGVIRATTWEMASGPACAA